MKRVNSEIEKKAVVLLSGGLDSATTAFIARKMGFSVFCLLFDYGQRHKKEVLSAIRLAEKEGFPFEVVKFKMPWGGSSLLDKEIGIPKKRSLGEIKEEIPSTYVPARNTIFIAFGVSYAEAIGASAVFIGANAIDFSGYPDCRPSYFKAFEKLISEGTKAGEIKIETPLLNKTKMEIIKLGIDLGVSHELTWSCYDGGEEPCGECDSCLLREKGFQEAGIIDPASKKFITA
jgi:7-cyano-7-deazaguanine synthase